MPKTRFHPFPDPTLQEPGAVEVVVQRRHLDAIARVEGLRRISPNQRVWVALSTDIAGHAADSPVVVQLLAPDGTPHPCGHLSESDTPGWRRLLQLRALPGITWVWPATITPNDTGSWRVVFYH